MKPRSDRRMESSIKNMAGSQISKDMEAIWNHNAESALLKLPQEIKEKIFGFVCGGSVIHINQHENRTYSKLWHRLCRSAISEERARDIFETSATDWGTYGNQYRHHKCLNDYHRRQLVPGLDCRFLRTCRQLYTDIRSVIYTSNEFAFDDYDALDVFMKSSPLCALVRGILIAMCSVFPYGGYRWRRVLKEVPKMMTGLRKMHYSIYQRRLADLLENPFQNEDPPAKVVMLSLAKLDLKVVTLVVTCHNWPFPTAGEKQLGCPTMEEMRVWVKDVRMKLLKQKPSGVESEDLSMNSSVCCSQ